MKMTGRQLLPFILGILLSGFSHSSSNSAFAFSTPTYSFLTNPLDKNNNKKRHPNGLHMCICIDCARVTNCAAYHFVESKHEQPHMTDHPTFEPQDGSPTIHVNIRTQRTADGENEMKRLWLEHKAETAKAEENQRLKKEEEESKDDDDGTNGSGTDDKLVGEKVYDMTPVTTYEYDVVQCADFVKDEGCWVRNMPEEIKIANPTFIPT